MPAFNAHPTLFFFKNPVRWLRVAFIEHPSYAWAVAIGGIAELVFFSRPVVDWAMGWNDGRRLFLPGTPLTYPALERARRPVDPKYDDPVGPVTTAINAARAPA